MKLGELELQNFLTIGAAKVNLADRGLVAIQGENNDDTSATSNGAGKSSIPDGVSWVAYGVTARGVTGDGVINRTAGKETRGALTIHEPDVLHKIVRHRKHKTGKNAVQLFQIAANAPAGTDWTDLTKGTDALTQVEINKVLGCSYDVFRAAVYAAQEEMPNLPGLTDKALKMLVEEAAGTTQLDAGYELARASLNAAKMDLQSSASLLERAKLTLAGVAGRIEETKRDIEGYEVGRKTQVDSQIQLVRTNVEWAKAKNVALAAIDVAALEAQLAGEEAKIAGVAGEQAEERRLYDLNTGAMSRFRSHQEAVDNHQRLAKSEREKISGVDKLIGCPCSACQRPLTADEVAPTKAGHVTRAEAYEKAAEKSAADLETARAEAQATADAVSAFRATMTDVSASAAVCASVRQQITAAKTIENERDLFKSAAMRAKHAAEDLAKAANPYQAVLDRLVGEEKDRAADVAKAEAAVVAAESAVQVAEHVARVFSPAGVRAHILDTVTPFLNDRTARYLGHLSDGNIAATWTTLVKTAKGDLREKFAIEVTNDKGGEQFKALSGGEKRKVRIATALALQDLTASRATKPIELFIGDEIDDALDGAGLERLTTVLEEKARERGSVFIISHNDLKDWVRTSITVTKSGGVSTLEEKAA